ncbi:cytochrome P450 6a8-like [Musca vetustissima]|uniref:cytochrome P450 6a8-like n=1 Tax=Musca vetustissima TaxID=27455 RepID=UPI002AB7BBAD|nr:cytochrome P450 6a8-like [Musca vetustissima]
MTDYGRHNSFNDIFHKYYNEIRASSPPLLGLYVFVTPVALITDLQLAKRILTKDFGYFHNRGLYHNPDDLTGNLFTLDYDRWKVFRTKLSPSFTSGKLKSMLPTFVGVSKELIKVMKLDIAEGNNIFDIKDLMLRFTLEIIGSCGFGCKTHSLQNPKDQFHQLIQNSFIGEHNGNVTKLLMIAFPRLAHLIQLQYLPANMIRFYTKFVKDILDTRKKSEVRYNYIIDTLNEIHIGTSDRKLTLTEITAQTLIFFQAGYETTAFTLTYALYELARNCEIQERAREESFRVLKSHNDGVTYECLSEMKYLQQVLKETLRLYPISPLIIRQCSKDYTVPSHSDILISKGQMIIIPAYSFQRDENYYPKATEFNPENFAADRSNPPLLSFGDGPRNCIDFAIT